MALVIFLLFNLHSVAQLTGAKKQLFVIAGQSNAEGYASLDGLAKLALALPKSEDSNPLSESARSEARQAVAESQGFECKSSWSTVGTADKAIDELRTSSVNWRAFTADKYFHPTVRIRAAHFTHGAVTLHRRDNMDLVDNGDCSAVPSETTRYGPTLSRYNISIGSSGAEFMPLAPGFGGYSPLGFGSGLERYTVTYGTELAFGETVAGTVSEAVLLKVAMGHSSLGDHWRIDGPLYARLVQETKDALQSQQASLGGLVWFQGFSDQWKNVWCQNMSTQYASNLITFLRRFRTDVGVNVPVVIIQAGNTFPYPHTGEHNFPLIQEAQAAVSAALDNVVLVPSADLTDCFHYDSGSLVVIGERAGRAMLQLLSKNTSTTTSIITEANTTTSRGNSSSASPTPLSLLSPQPLPLSLPADPSKLVVASSDQRTPSTRSTPDVLTHGGGPQQQKPSQSGYAAWMMAGSAESSFNRKKALEKQNRTNINPTVLTTLGNVDAQAETIALGQSRYEAWKAAQEESDGMTRGMKISVVLAMPFAASWFTL